MRGGAHTKPLALCHCCTVCCMAIKHPAAPMIVPPLSKLRTNNPALVAPPTLRVTIDPTIAPIPKQVMERKCCQSSISKVPFFVNDAKACNVEPVSSSARSLNKATSPTGQDYRSIYSVTGHSIKRTTYIHSKLQFDQTRRKLQNHKVGIKYKSKTDEQVIPVTCTRC